MALEWTRVADLNLALRNLHEEFLGDWYRDPWGWPETDWTVTRRPELVFQRLASDGARPFAPIDVPKENYLIRPAVILDPLDRLAYQAVVDRLSRRLIQGLSSNVFGWRLPITSPAAGAYSPNKNQWERYRSHLSALVAEFDFALKTDIVSCFASIQMDILVDSIDELAGKTDIAQRLLSMLEAWSRSPNRTGIPQRSTASSVIANALLAGLDDVLEYYSKPMQIGKSTRRSYARWMDDMWLFGDDASHLRQAQVELQSTLRSKGLHMNSGKTKLLEGPEIAEHALDVEHSAVDGAFDLDGILGTDQGPSRLDELIEKLLAQKEEASRTSIKFATRRMRVHGRFEKVNDFVTNAARMPHGSDALARLFRDAGRSVDLQDWFLDYRKSNWARLEWPSAQLVTMFASSIRPAEGLIEHVGESLGTRSLSLPLTAAFAQRLAAWDPPRARVAITEAINHAGDPFRRRVLSLAGLAAGIGRKSLRIWLREFEENSVTLQMLEDANFASVHVKNDFA